MKEKIAKLIDIKSIVTILLCGVFAYLSIIGKIAAEQFITIFTIVISFYFGIQSQKSANKEDNKNG